MEQLCTAEAASKAVKASREGGHSRHATDLLAIPRKFVRGRIIAEGIHEERRWEKHILSWQQNFRLCELVFYSIRRLDFG